MKARILNSLSARCTSACPLRHTCTREEKHRERRAKNKHATFVKKGERFSSEEEKNRKKVHNFSHTFRRSHFSPHFPSRKPLTFERKLLPLHLTKHNPPFFSPHCGVYIARKAGHLPCLNANDLWLTENDEALFRFIGLKHTHRFAKCAALVVSFHFHHIVHQVFQKKFVFLPQVFPKGNR